MPKGVKRLGRLTVPGLNIRLTAAGAAKDGPIVELVRKS